MAALDQIKRWPVTSATAVVCDRRRTLAWVGETGRVYPFASVTKMFSAFATLVACEQGLLELDRPAGPPGSTIRHLLAHTSGLAFLERRALAKPGRRRIYSNPGFDVLGEEVSRAVGAPFGDFLFRNVLQPLGLDLRLTGSPASGLAGTIDDLAVFARELLEPRLVAARTLAEATSVQFEGLAGVLPGYGNQRPNDWGLGFEIRSHKQPHWMGERNSPRSFGHVGASGSFLWVDPDAELALACLSTRRFGRWAKLAWPQLSDDVLVEYGGWVR